MITEEKQQDPVTYQHAVWLPCVQKVPRRPATGGVFDKGGKPIANTRLMRHYFQPGAKVEDSPGLEKDPAIRTEVIVGTGKPGKTTKKLQGLYIFGGYFFPHYGHFLLETLARLWFFKGRSEIPVVWMSFGGAEMEAWHIELIRLLGVENELICLNEQTEFEELIVPEPGYVISSRFWEKQAEALALAPKQAVTPGKKIWLSRSALNKGVFLNEPKVEEALEADGWILYRPELDSVPEQVRMLSDAEHIAGIEGSAFHTMILMPHYQGKLTIFSRVEEADFDLIARTNESYMERVKTHSYSLPRYGNSWGNEFISWWQDIDSVLLPLGAGRNGGHDKPMPGPLRNVVRSLADYYKAASFLEFFPQENTLTTELGGTLRGAVTEAASYDVSAAKAKGVKQFDVSPEVLVTTGCLKKPVDLYCLRFLDDLDTLVRTFNCSLAASHADTLWVVEAPPNALANRQLLAQLQQANPAVSLAWVTDKGVAVIWRAMRPLSLPALRAFRRTDIGQSDTPEIPRMPLREIAGQIDKERRSRRVNAL